MQEVRAEKLPEIFRETQRVMTLADGAEQPSKIAFLRANFRAELEFILLIMLENLDNEFNVKERLSSDQMEDCYMTIIANYGQVSPEELLYVFRRAKAGFYGPVYNRLDTATICGWINEYVNGERLTYFQQSRFEKKETRQREFDASKAYLKEHEFQKEHGKPSLVAQSEERKREELKEKLRSQLAAFNESKITQEV